MKKVLYITDINPEPWTVPTGSVGYKHTPSGRKPYVQMSKHPVLRDYQTALQENIDEAYPELEPFPKGMMLQITFLFWRRLDSYVNSGGRRSTRHHCDATNLQKATEDALEGRLYHNDADNVRVTSEIIAQGRDVEPAIAVIMETYTGKHAWGAMVSALPTGDMPFPPGNVLIVEEP